MHAATNFRDERPFHMNAERFGARKVSAGDVVSQKLDGVHRLVGWCRNGGWVVGRRSEPRERSADVVEGVALGLHHVTTACAVIVSVDETRDEVAVVDREFFTSRRQLDSFAAIDSDHRGVFDNDDSILDQIGSQ